MGFHTIPGIGGYTEGARAYHSIAQAIVTNGWRVVSLDSERFDTDTIHDLILNNSRLTCKTAGKYEIIGMVGLASLADTNIMGVQIWLNGVTSIGETSMALGALGSYIMQVSAIYDLAVTDFVELRVYHTFGANRNTLAVGNSTVEFMMQRIG